MDTQNDQDASPGYMGPEGLGESPEPEERQKGFLGSLGEAVKDLITGHVPGGAEEAARHSGAGMDAELRRDTGMATADVQNDPYAGSAAEDDVVGQALRPDTDAHFPFDPRD